MTNILYKLQNPTQAQTRVSLYIQCQ